MSTPGDRAQEKHIDILPPLVKNAEIVDISNRDGEKFICTECGYHEHADIDAAKTMLVSLYIALSR
ncbi:hypothetical protein [Nostoc sp. DedQUE09]|uniref:hypothetical protein n=1 Tax=Nostoc sp. DedQUE09 TaxID=3075394 RepID=UPI002AD1E402|nr:hypothetical protein [Nostoc sp. DedQUE09]MDZ7950823.1 hypothetical protein [Nostoc sp. DedQUE09]